jgi:RNA polymerase sigma factor (sigma-70 family)
MSPKDSKSITSAWEDEHKRLLGYIRKRIPIGEHAEDILQDIFYQLTVGFRDIRRIESLTSWLYKVADNRITDLFRKRKHEVISYNDTLTEGEEGPMTLGEILPAVGTTPYDKDLKDRIWETIEETLSELSKEQRSVFIETEFEEKSFREISGKTGVGISTLISRKRYAVLALRKNLDELYKLLKNY